MTRRRSSTPSAYTGSRALDRNDRPRRVAKVPSQGPLDLALHSVRNLPPIPGHCCTVRTYSEKSAASFRAGRLTPPIARSPNPENRTPAAISDRARSRHVGLGQQSAGITRGILGAL